MQERLGLTVDEAVPLVGIIGRFTDQKGFDLVLECALHCCACPVHWPSWVREMRAFRKVSSSLRAHNPGKVGVHIGYDESMAHQIEAGADIFLMPSRFEPCGLNQMYSQRYGTPVVAHDTGGLVDSIVDTTPETINDKTASGFLFSSMTSKALLDGVQRAVRAYDDKNSGASCRRTAWRATSAGKRALRSTSSFTRRWFPAKGPLL